MTASELKHRLLRVIGINTPASAQASAVDSVVHAINHAYQVLWQDVPKENRLAYTRRTDNLTLTPGMSSIELSGDVQSVVPPIRRLPALIPLRPVSHRSEVENYGLLSGRKVTDVPAGAPQVYFLESRHQAAADSLRLTILVAPTPVVNTDLRIEVELEAPNIVASDLCCDTPAPLRIPNAYAESLLYPIAAYHLATQSAWFKRQEAFPAIEAEYERAKARLGIVDPSAVAAKSHVTPSDR